MFKDLHVLNQVHLTPYLEVASALIGKKRHAGGNMFRHQVDTMAILIDYGYIDSVLLKASLVHDVIEDIPNFDESKLLDIEPEAKDVYKLVLEVTKQEGQSKEDFLRRIAWEGSEKAKILKCADRISNMIALGYVTDSEFIARYCEETECFIFPIAMMVNDDMYEELLYLTRTRSKYLEDSGYLEAIYTKQIEDAAN